MTAIEPARRPALRLAWQLARVRDIVVETPLSGRRQPSCDGTSRMMREYQVRFCEGLGVKFPGSTRHLLPSRRAAADGRSAFENGKIRPPRRSLAAYPLDSSSADGVLVTEGVGQQRAYFFRAL